MDKPLKDIVWEILKSDKPDKTKKHYYLFIKKIVAQKVRSYFPQEDYQSWEYLAEEITQDFFLWLLKEENKRKFLENKDRFTSGYFVKKINGLIIDHLRKVDTLQKHIPISLDEKIEDESKNLTLKDFITDKKFELESIDWIATAGAFIKTLENELKEDYLKTLCYWIFRDKYSTDCYLENLSSAAKYKRIERLKKLLREILERHPLEKEEWQKFVELMEVYCQKRFGKCV